MNNKSVEFSNINISKEVDLDNIYEYSRYQTNCYYSSEGTAVMLTLKPQKSDYYDSEYDRFYDSKFSEFFYAPIGRKKEDPIEYWLPCAKGFRQGNEYLEGTLRDFLKTLSKEDLSKIDKIYLREFQYTSN